MTSSITPWIARLLAFIVSVSIGFFVGTETHSQWIGFSVYAFFLLWYLSKSIFDIIPFSLPILNNLKTISGKASDIRHSTLTTGSENNISTYQVAAFDLNGTPVQLKMGESIFISEGEKVVVSGLLRRGVLSGLAYHNQSRHLTARAPTAIYLLFSILAIFFGLSFLNDPDVVTGGKGLIFIGIWFLHTVTTIFNAARLAQTT